MEPIVPVVYSPPYVSRCAVVLCYLPGLVKHSIEWRLHLMMRRTMLVTVDYRLTLMMDMWWWLVDPTSCRLLRMLTLLRADAMTI